MPSGNIESFVDKFEQELRALDRELSQARAISREAVYRIVYVSGAIVGFSVTIVSTAGLKLGVDMDELKAAWALFIIVAGLGLLLNLVEARTQYVLAWRKIQPVRWDYKTELSIRDDILAGLVFLYSLLISPRNLFLCRNYSNAPVELKEKRERQNGLTIKLANLTVNFQLFSEGLFIVLFILALTFIVFSIM